VANCAHGFPQSECLICKTLGTGPSQTMTARTKVASAPAPADELTVGQGSRSLATRQAPAAEEAPRDRRGTSTFWAVVLVLVVGGLLLWAFAGVVSIAFRIGEYVLLALAAGWVGYKLGHARGRRGH